MIKTVIGSFDNFAIASLVAADLIAAGFMQSDINVLSNNTSREITDPIGSIPIDANGEASSAVTGGAIGGAAGFAIGLMGLAVPGVGPILAAGPIITALAGAGAGAVAGGLVGGLTNVGVPEKDAQYYAESIRRGGALVTVKVDLSRVEEAEHLMRRQGAIDIEERIEQWKGNGWSGYDAEAGPYSFDQIEQERQRYAGRTQQQRTLPPF